MKTILAITSQVSRDTVGLSVVDFTLKRLGHHVISMPTILLSNHPGHRISAGRATDPELLCEMLEAIEYNGWLMDVDGVLTGYLPTPAHVRFAHLAVERTRLANPAVLYLCDPVLGDDPTGLYIDEDAARSIREDLVPHADIVTPNRFELSWLSGRQAANPAENAEAAHQLACHRVVATSVPVPGSNELANLLREGNRVYETRVSQNLNVPHGTGDFFAALFLSRLLKKGDGRDALGFATAAVDRVVGVPEKSGLLAIADLQDAWAAAEPFPVTTFQYLS